jgi:aminoglycoside phosphotransferase
MWQCQWISSSGEQQLAGAAATAEAAAPHLTHLAAGACVDLAAALRVLVALTHTHCRHDTHTHSYWTLAEAFMLESEVKKSRFIATAWPVTTTAQVGGGGTCE